MLLEGKFTLKAPIKDTWDFLLMPETLVACIPGCEQWKAIDEKTFESIVVAKVGFISVKFKFTTTLTEIDPPRHLKAVGRGEDLGKHGSFKSPWLHKMDFRSTRQLNARMCNSNPFQVV